ncbi:1,6-Anhydro-N-acetylmuramate kinase [Lentimicrobium saccharophilum]|uniref:1,6-Anhydro-N-acetylmuramate kinase n=1 Tax=Lentimicrobium saccharophilum TaxID=1678841 RepID=A0A0S7BVN2_9BACT|nr:anhydro-N-acetylmuramic acid kinase [Lentimicrobium saccharophilum]GAP45013.1 1,6-Anhydro-N-acetylmuramate kinase [Lentimicrobium saccharophilum]
MHSEREETVQAIGLMSGTSLDGLDIACCTFGFSGDKTSFSINCAETIPYQPDMILKLRQAEHAGALEFFRIHNAYGQWTGEVVRDFTERYHLHPLLIASHGHTVFHRPEEGFTVQAGNGAQIAAITGIRTVCDFRSIDVALGGQGAPLVPVGDRLLFGNYHACVNIGGFSNISMESEGSRIAWDICPANYVLNHYAGLSGLKFDDSGKIARSGNLIPGLFQQLNSLDYYSAKPPKSLGREWVEANIYPLADKYLDDIPGILHTLTMHIAEQISLSLPETSFEKVLLTGGGVHNNFLIEIIRKMTSCHIEIPEPKIINFKEALIFALLGVLRYKKIPNCLAYVTGAVSDSIGGAIYEA